MSARIPNHLLALLVIYCLASFIHFAHNAELVSDYPNLPIWLTRSKVYLAWLAVTAVGAVGIVLFKLRLRLLGLLLIAGYAALGFAGLDHYWVAPVSAHSFVMNATIWLEVAAAATLLVAAVRLLFYSAQSSLPIDDSLVAQAGQTIQVLERGRASDSSRTV